MATIVKYTPPVKGINYIRRIEPADFKRASSSYNKTVEFSSENNYTADVSGIDALGLELLLAQEDIKEVKDTASETSTTTTPATPSR